MKDIKNIVISGGSGLIGKVLAKVLIEEGYNVFILTRNKNISSNKGYIYWNNNTGVINDEAIENTDAIIHLAGANIGEKRWTKIRKKEIIDSRVKTTELLFKHINKNKLKCVISASATGYYGAVTSNEIYDENHKNSNDFLGTVCKEWEQSTTKFAEAGIRTTILRTGVVLSGNGGVLPIILKPIKYGLGAALGSGKQYMPWIHITDLCNMYKFALENNSITGIFNAVAPEHINNKELTKKIAKQINKNIILPNIPSFLLKIALGKMSSLLLEGSRVSCNKIISSGFKFSFPTIDSAIDNLI